VKARTSRRRFLQAGIATSTAALAAPWLLPAAARGANDRIVLGGIGVGNQGSSLVRAFSRSCSIAAIADVYLPRAEEVAKSVGAKHVYQDYRKLLEHDDIDAVLIATPHRWHALNCIHAAQAGKDIYCEKPLTYSILEGRRIVQAVRKYQRVFQTGSQQRSGSSEYQGCMYVRNGAIGKLTHVVASNYHSPMEPKWPEQEIPDGLDWDRWCGPAEPPPYNFVIWDNRSNPSWVSISPFSGGEVTDWGSHGLDMAQWGLGMDDSGPEEIWTEGEPFKPLDSTPEAPGGRHRGVNAPRVFMKYPGDIVMELAGGPGNSGVRFVGEKGSITVVRGRFSSDPAELTAQPLKDPQVELYRSTNHHADWLNCIKERRDPVAHAEAGHRSATVCHLMNIARWVSQRTGETGQRLQWDASNERFTNSPEGNAYLDPPRRKGYELPAQV
jgi:predicted dehydrogenase